MDVKAPTLRRADPGDAEAIHELLLAAFSAFRPQYTPGCYEATVLDAARVRQRLAEGPIWVAQWQGRMVGTVGARFDDRGLYVRGMAVHPEARRLGLGKRLLDAAAAYARDHGASTLWLSTTRFLAASQALYTSYGFRQTDGPAELEGTPLVSFVKHL